MAWGDKEFYKQHEEYKDWHNDVNNATSGIDFSAIPAASPFSVAASLTDFVPTNNLTIYGPNQKILVSINTETGEIDYGDDYAPDAAAKIFWEAMSHSAPGVRANREIPRADPIVKTAIQRLRERVCVSKDLNSEQEKPTLNINVDNMLTAIRKRTQQKYIPDIDVDISFYQDTISAPVENSTYRDTNDGQLYMWNGGYWKAIDDNTVIAALEENTKSSINDDYNHAMSILGN